MSSQKSSGQVSAPPVAVEPKRERGRRRVAAILDAGAAVIAEKGFEAATMSEIAARSAAAIGSLYRFFPTKDVLADALLDRYVGEIAAQLAEIHGTAPGLGPQGVADALVEMVLGLQADRAAAVVLVDTKADGPARREALRSAFRDGLAAILRSLAPALPPAQVGAAAAVVLHVMKTGPALLARASEQERQDRLEELRRVLRLYFAGLGAEAAPKRRERRS